MKPSSPTRAGGFFGRRLHSQKIPRYARDDGVTRLRRVTPADRRPDLKAMMCRAFGPPETLVLEESPSAALAPGQVRVQVHASGVNFPDLLMMQGKYQFKP